MNLCKDCGYTLERNEKTRCLSCSLELQSFWRDVIRAVIKVLPVLLIAGAILLVVTSCNELEYVCSVIEEPVYYTLHEGEPVRFTTFPLQIVAKESELLDVKAYAWVAATRWNDDVSDEVFTLDECEGCPKVFVEMASNERAETFRELHGFRPLSTATPVLDTETWTYTRGEVNIMPDFLAEDGLQQVGTLQHEFGHVLGMNHDPYWKKSLMGRHSKICRASIGHIEWVQQQLEQATRL